MVVGKLAIYRDWPIVGCDSTITIIDHPIENDYGLLDLAVNCGATKNTRQRVLLTPQAKKVLDKILNKQHKESEETFKYMDREKKLPILDITDVRTNDIMVLMEVTPGKRGGNWFKYEGGASRLLHVGECNRSYCVDIVLAHLPPNGRVIVERTRRRFDRYLVFLNNNGVFKNFITADLHELEII